MENSLRRGLIARLAPVIFILLLLDALACYYTAAHFSNVVYDRWLVDSARSLATAIKVDNGNVSLELPHVAREIFQFDEVDKTYFRVNAADQVIAGDAAVPDLGEIGSNDPRFEDARVQGEPVRLVAIAAPGRGVAPVIVEVAETLHKRERLRGDIVLAMLAPQLGLLAIAILLAWFGIARGLKPLTDLGEQLAARGHDNLSSVPEHGLPREVRALVAKINDLLARLASAITMQKRFVADAAHQLRTPLAAILLYAERAERALESREHDEGRDTLKRLHSAANRATHLSNQLLTLARAEPSAVLAQDFVLVDLTAFARNVGEDWITRALAQDSDFGLVVPDEEVVVRANAHLLGELISNLIDNALRYAGPGSRITLSVASSPAPCIAVEDNGPGIPPEARERIFERFYRLGQSGASGCGLGLAIVKQIADAHGAGINVETGPDGRGARFVLSFVVSSH